MPFDRPRRHSSSSTIVRIMRNEVYSPLKSQTACSLSLLPSVKWHTVILMTEKVIYLGVYFYTNVKKTRDPYMALRNFFGK